MPAMIDLSAVPDSHINALCDVIIRIAADLQKSPDFSIQYEKWMKNRQTKMADGVRDQSAE